MRLILCAMLVVSCVRGQQSVSIRLLFGGDDAKWEVAVVSRGASIRAVEPWRFEGEDVILPDHSWKFSTHRIRLFGGGPKPFVPNGLIVTLENAGEDTSLDVTTTRGNFSIRLSEIPYGSTRREMEGQVAAERLPATSRLTDSADEQDDPAAATDSHGNVWLAYREFRHTPIHDRLRAGFLKSPADFSEFKTPALGDQILLKKFSGNSWQEPLAVTPPGGDLDRPAIAVDGSGRPWVFWSQNTNGNFDLCARSINGATPGAIIRITHDPGANVDPVAVTDSTGRVWVAWQSWRNGRASIMSATQRADGFSNSFTVSSGSANDWNPAIAADSHGNIAIAWDTYRNGNYDIGLRRVNSSSAWKPETLAIASARYEAYPSLAFDQTGTLWMAYEEGSEKWGKDFGAYDSSSVALYEGRAIRLLGFEASGKVITTARDLGEALPGVPTYDTASRSRQIDLSDWEKPDPQLARTRQANQHICNSLPYACATPSPKNSLPRLHIDASGRLTVAYRTEHPIRFNAYLGSVWFEQLASYDGANWIGPISLAHTDNLLDNRPALVSTTPGELMVIGSSDSRGSFHEMPRQSSEVVRDPYNNDLFASRIQLPPLRGPFETHAVNIPQPVPDPEASDEKAAVSRLRGYRLQVEPRSTATPAR